MPCIRLTPSANIIPIATGAVLRSDLGTFQLSGADVSAFLSRIVPMLDGSRDRESLARSLGDYSPSSVAALLDLLESHGLIEAVPDPAEGGDRERFRGQEEFLRRWPERLGDPTRRLAEAHVAVVGLEPWGVVAAAELAAAGVGALSLLDDGAASPGFGAALGQRGRDVRGRARAEVLAEVLRERAPTCRVQQHAASALTELARAVAEAPPTLLVAAVRPDDAGQIERIAHVAHREKLVSLWSHLAGASAVLGPLVTPGETACRVCAAVDALNPPLPTASGRVDRGRAYVMERLFGHLLAMEALKVISRYARSWLGGRVMIGDLATQESSLHMLVRLPWCRVCGDG